MGQIIECFFFFFLDNERRQCEFFFFLQDEGSCALKASLFSRAQVWGQSPADACWLLWLLWFLWLNGKTAPSLNRVSNGPAVMRTLSVVLGSCLWCSCRWTLKGNSLCFFTSLPQVVCEDTHTHLASYSVNADCAPSQSQNSQHMNVGCKRTPFTPGCLSSPAAVNEQSVGLWDCFKTSRWAMMTPSSPTRVMD